MRAGKPTGAGLRLTVYRVDADGRHHGEAQLAAGLQAPPASVDIPCRCRSCSAETSR
jgi:hypothetical protein